MGKLTFQGVDVPKAVAFDLRNKLGALNFPKTRKFTVPYRAGRFPVRRKGAAR